MSWAPRSRRPRIKAIAGSFDAMKRLFYVLRSERAASVTVAYLWLSGLADACDRLPSGGIAAGGWSVCPEGSFRSGHLPMPAAGMSCENARHRSAPVPPAKRGRFGTAAEASVRCTGLALNVSRVPKGHVAMVGRGVQTRNKSNDETTRVSGRSNNFLDLTDQHPN